MSVIESRRAVRRMLSVGTILILAGCTAGPNFQRPAATADTRYTTQGEVDLGQGDAAADAQHVAYGAKLAADWWSLFHSRDLDRVVQQAIADNHTLAAARATLAQAGEQVAAGRGRLYPQIDANAGAERELVNLAAFGFKGENPTINLFSLGGNISFDLDLAGGTRRQIENLIALADAQAHQVAAAYLSLSGNVVVQAITIASINAQIAAVTDIIASDERNVSLTQTSFAAGFTTQVDVLAAQSQLANDRTLLPPLRQQLGAARHALAVYVGRAPADWSPPDFQLAELVLPRDVPVSLPSALVHQRPDILVAEQQLHAASAAIGVAEARLYPDINLTAGVEQQALKTGFLFANAYNGWNFGAGLTTPLFHGGTLRAEKRAAEDAYKASLETYQQTVLHAFAQVADQLQALDHDGQELAEQQRALDVAQNALELARASFQDGATGVLNVLEAQRQFQQARLGYVRAQAQRYLDTAELLVATGSGWPA